MAHGGLLVPGRVGPVGQPLIALQNPAPQARVILLVTASGEGRRIGASGDPHRAGGEDHDGPRGGIAAPPRLQGLRRSIHGQLPCCQHRLRRGLEPGLSLRHADRSGGDAQSRGRRPLHRKAERSHRLRGRRPGDATHLGVVVQIHAPGRLGKALVQHPLALDAQGLQLRCRSVQPHGQIAVCLWCEARPLGEGRQQRLVDLLCRFQTTAPLTIPPR